MVGRQRHMPPWKRTIAMRTSYLRTTRKRMRGTFLEAKPVDNCEHCNAKKFEFEPPGFCYHSGKIHLSTHETPPRLVRLWSSSDADARHFRANIRYFNGHFSFTSMYCKLDRVTTDHRLRKCREKSAQEDREVIQRLKDILHGINPYSENLRSMEVAAVWIEGSERRGQFDNSVVLQGKDRSIHGIRSYHGCYDALSYPLFFPRGELGWHNCIPKVSVTMAEVNKARAIRKARADGGGDDDAGSAGNKCVSVRDYYCYKFQMRPGIFNPILHGKRLFQQFAIDTYVKIESSCLDYIRNNQDILRADLYQGLVDSWRMGVEDADEVGPRNMRRRYMDAMALVRKFGKPDIFLTMTCNPNWDEIKNELYPGQSPQDRPNLVSRVFRAKLEELKKMLMEKDILGKRKYKITCPEQYDLLISAELPNKKKYPDLYRMVTKHMMHGPCGTLNPLCPCTRGCTSCKNRYPRPFCDSTSQGKDSYPIYRRRDDGRKEIIRGHILDNQWVIPYNPCLLRTFNCHINVEACSSIKSVKYLFKYIYKGHDRASVAVREVGKKDDKGNVDEITQYREARIYGFDLSKNHPPVQQLQLHLPDMHMVTYHKRDKIERVVKRPGADESMLIAYFDYNRLHEEALGILYRDFPEHYTWESNGKFWKPRKNAIYQVGRLVSAHPAEGERYFLRVLLNHVAGATSYRDLRTVDGVLLPSFREAAERRGLIEEDNTLDECLTENNLFHMPSSLRRLFATILVFCEPNDVFGLWTKHLDAMLEDYRRNNPNPSLVEQMVLIDIRNMLQSMGKDIRSFPLLGIDDAYDNASGIPREIFEEASIDQDLEDRAAYEEIMSKVDTEQGGLFFVDGLGGTGKTFLYRALLETLHNQNKLAIATATSGVAASIMPGGRTAYSRFKIPLTLEDGGCCSFTKQSGTAKLLQQASLIIWDEASMAKRQAMEALDNSLRDIMGRQDLPFGGKTVVFGGDFRQVLLVVRKGSRAQIVDASLWRSYLWESMHHLKLVRNMRAQSDPWFAEYLLRIGGGTEEVNGDGDKDLDRLIECIFPNLNANMTNKDYITSRAILSTRNDWVDNINIKMIGMFQGGEMVYHSFDSAIDDPHNYYPSEFLNTLTPNGLPPHLLKLKIGCPVILLRNIDPANGLCNGTRHAFATLSFIAEIFLFMYVGMDAFDIEKREFAGDRCSSVMEPSLFEMLFSLPRRKPSASYFN
ncbi:hypothetical protein SETIT_5G173100v2 [Setaria italica]|uniref:ATP-dependent DNA helicase n=1 Tax=Setaria italica TaxID=4555 RepID=A0A368R5R2_SETIT|nr:hypothetical protein SETIT_5G173100v2 [Setaria italica]